MTPEEFVAKHNQNPKAENTKLKLVQSMG